MIKRKIKRKGLLYLMVSGCYEVLVFGFKFLVVGSWRGD